MFGSFKAKKRLSDAEEALAKLERDFKTLRLEWENTYAKHLSIVQRISKKAQLIQEAESDTDNSEGQEVTDVPNVALSERQRKIQAQILARRRNGLLPG